MVGGIFPVGVEWTNFQLVWGTHRHPVSIIVSWYLFLAPLGGQNIILIFSNLRVSTFLKSMRGCPNRWLFSKIEVFYRPERTEEVTHENEFWLFSNTKMNVTNSSSGKSRWKKWGHLASFHVSFLIYGP